MNEGAENKNTFLIEIVSEYEKKLKELMGPDKYAIFAEKVAKKAFKKELEEMEDCDFKEFCLENIEKIYGGN